MTSYEYVDERGPWWGRSNCNRFCFLQEIADSQPKTTTTQCSVSFLGTYSLIENSPITCPYAHERRSAWWYAQVFCWVLDIGGRKQSSGSKSRKWSAELGSFGSISPC